MAGGFPGAQPGIGQGQPAGGAVGSAAVGFAGGASGGGGGAGPYGGGEDIGTTDDRQHPVRLIMPYPEEGSRLQALLFTFLAPIGGLIMIPHVLWLYLLAIAAGFVNFISFFAILFTGRYPRGMWEFMRKFLRHIYRIMSYTGVLTVGYPPFGLSSEDYGLDLDIPYPEKSSRLWLFLAFIAIIPVNFVNFFYGIASGFIGFLGGFAVLFTGRYPQSWFEFVRKVNQHRLRIMCFTFWIRNEYPPFGLDD